MIPKKIQTSITRAALTAAFRPRFEAIAKAAELECRAQLAEQHPDFLRLAADPTVRPYLYIAQVVYPRIECADSNALVRLFAPGEALEHGEYFPPATWSGTRSASATPLSILMDRPAARDFVPVVSDGLTAEYLAAWADLKAALDATVTLLASARRLSDVPELAAFAPTPAPAKQLPAVNLDPLREQLRRYGVTK